MAMTATSYKPVETPFFCPRSVLSQNHFDYRKMLCLIGTRLPDVFSDTVKQMVGDTSMIYQVPMLAGIDRFASVDESDPLPDVKLRTVPVMDFHRFESITFSSNSGYRHAPELAFGISTVDGELIYLSESDVARLYCNKIAISNSHGFLSFGDVVNDLAERQLLEFYRLGKWPTEVSASMRRELEPITGPDRILSGQADYMATLICEINRLPYLDRGQLIRPGSADVEVPDIPELAADDQEEARQLNPEFGALAF